MILTENECSNSILNILILLKKKNPWIPLRDMLGFVRWCWGTVEGAKWNISSFTFLVKSIHTIFKCNLSNIVVKCFYVLSFNRTNKPQNSKSCQESVTENFFECIRLLKESERVSCWPRKGQAWGRKRQYRKFRWWQQMTPTVPMPVTLDVCFIEKKEFV